ncbi:MAG: hypothetical protein ABSB79_06380 [Syntrophales bacterium]
MIEELDLLSSIAGKMSEGKPNRPQRAKFEASIIATYNAYLPFYEEVVLKRLASSGCQYNVLLLDNGDLTKSLMSPTAQPRLAGRAYTLVPMQAASAFHPKIALLVGKNSGRVFIGSHNVTLSGYGHNREITTQIELDKGSEDPDAPLASAVWKFLNVWLGHQSDRIPQSIITAAQKVATNFAPWLLNENIQSGDVRFVGADPSGSSLWNLVRPMLPKKAKRVIAIGPFFDRAGNFIKNMAHDLQTVDIVLGVEPDSVVLCRQDNLPTGVRFVDASSVGRGKDKGYLHAKGLWVQGEDGQFVLVTGSANPSSPAWTEVPKKRNAEAVIVHLGNSALKLAEALGITSIPAMPELGKETLELLAKRSAQPKMDSKNSASTYVVIAEALEKEILIHYQGSEMGQVKIIRCWEYGKEKYFSPSNISWDNLGLHINMKIEDLNKVGFLDVELEDGRLIQAFVHHPTTIARLNRTSNQRRFQEALNSLESESPDLPTLIRLAANLIFDESVTPPPPISKGQGKKEKEETEPLEEPLGSLSIPIEDTKGRRKRIKEFRGGDLAYIIDTLIYRLGLSLRTDAEQLEIVGSSEEEQIGKEEEPSPSLDEIPKFDLIKAIQGKIRTLVNRMLKNFGKKEESGVPNYRPVEQLLAVLAVMREVRVQDKRFAQLSMGQSLVPLEYRKQLLDGSITALFGSKQRLFASFTDAMGDDPEEDVSRLLGLLLWLAYDSRMDVRELHNFLVGNPEERRERLFNLSRLLEIAIASGRDNEAFTEAELSIWKTTPESMRVGVSKWIWYHREWSKEIFEIFSCRKSLKTGTLAKIGGIGIATKEKIPKLRVIYGLDKENAHFVETGEKDNTVSYRLNFVDLADMPIITANQSMIL